MNRPLTIVMFDNVGDLQPLRFSAIESLSVERFCRKIDYIQIRYARPPAEDWWEALSSPKRTCRRTPSS
jgi:hypothetical protein